MSGYPLQQIEIDRFRGFRDFTLPALGGVNVLVGGNNSGKTSVLEAISVLCAPTEPIGLFNMTRLRDPGGIDESRLHSLRWCFHRAEPPRDQDELISAQCSMQVNGSFGLQRLIITLSEFVGEPSAKEMKGDWPFPTDVDGDKIDRVRRGADISYEPVFVPTQADGQVRLMPDAEKYSFRIWDELPVTRYTKSRNVPRLGCEMLYPYSYQMNSLQVRTLSRRGLDQKNLSVADLLQQFDADVIDVDIQSSHGYRPAIYLKHRRLGLAPLSVFGDAMRRSVLLASTLSSLSPGSVLLIDEAEAGIHVEAQPKFFAWLMASARQRQIQVFLTTHSLEALDAMLTGLPGLADETDLVVYQLKRDATNIRCKRFAGDLLHRLRFERGLDVR
ncbi:MAG: hypothetical protein RLY71_1185 [Pseudomonadota bacterium]|jgi:energy-coupling factor transporter ATP-binding protein EcfA2